MTKILDAQQTAAVDDLRAQIARMNDAVKRAVDSGLTVEITRASRHHSPQSCWGDQMIPKIVATHEMHTA
ncbi:MAG: hypothetical protein JNM81_01060 [Rhodospirillaceae bacterium]|nr:hypothetical protein [Rhodospirillaceae bacterium]